MDGKQIGDIFCKNSEDVERVRHQVNLGLKKSIIILKANAKFAQEEDFNNSIPLDSVEAIFIVRILKSTNHVFKAVEYIYDGVLGVCKRQYK